MSVSILPPRKIKFHVTEVEAGYRAICPALPGYSRFGKTPEAAAWELEKVLLEKLAGKAG